MAGGKRCACGAALISFQLSAISYQRESGQLSAISRQLRAVG